VYRDDRPIVLLNLFFPQSKVGYEWDIEILFYQWLLPLIAKAFLMEKGGIPVRSRPLFVA